MQKSTFLALAGTLFISAALPQQAVFAETVPVVAGATVGEVTGTVMVVNTEKRMLTLKKPDGHFQVIHVPEEVKRLDEIKINDEMTISYMEAVAVDLTKTGVTAPGVVATKEVDREPGKKPAGGMIETITLSGVVEGVDKARSLVTVRGPEKTVSVTVQDPALLEDVAVGDGVEVKYISAVAAEVK
ncbi:MAG: hypothetical protein U9Q81_02675 [Pseudomonadota bacterium]|nr:hypothetical protein [Pseudomonadota bacterium]